jgi:hypothetical protein
LIFFHFLCLGCVQSLNLLSLLFRTHKLNLTFYIFGIAIYRDAGTTIAFKIFKQRTRLALSAAEGNKEHQVLPRLTMREGGI